MEIETEIHIKMNAQVSRILNRRKGWSVKEVTDWKIIGTDMKDGAFMDKKD